VVTRIPPIPRHPETKSETKKTFYQLKMSHQSPETIRRHNQLLFSKLQTILQKQNPSAYWLNPEQVYPSRNYFKSIDASPKSKLHQSAEKLRKKSIAL
jgi:hypothetical protein